MRWGMGTRYYSPRWVQSYRTFTSKKGTRTRNSLIWGLVGPPASDKLIPHCCLLEKPRSGQVGVDFL